MRHHAAFAPARQRRGAGARAGIAGAAAVLAALLVFGAAPAALAHDQLVGTTPATGSNVDEAPTEVMMEFSNSLMELGTEIKVTDSSGENVATGEPQLRAREVTQALTPGLPDDEYTVTWRVVSSDSHPISGKFSFTVGNAVAEAPSAAPSASETPAPEPSSGSEQTAPPADGFDWARAGFIALGGLLLGGAGYAFIAVRARRK